MTSDPAVNLGLSVVVLAVFRLVGGVVTDTDVVNAGRHEYH